MLLGTAFNVRGVEFACGEEEAEADGINDLFTASNGKEEVEVERVKSGCGALSDGRRWLGGG